MRISTVLLVTVCGCASQRWTSYDVTSDPVGCGVEVNGQALGTTPCQIKLAYSTRWVGVLNAPGGFARGQEEYEVVCMPPVAGGNNYLPQSKRIIPSQSMDGHGVLHFRLTGVAIYNQPATPPAGATNVVSSGSGFFVTESGYLATNYHVVEGANRIVIRYKGELLPATLILADRINDLALLKVEGRFSALPIARRSPDLGDDVLTVGFPNTDVQGISPKLTKGSINSLSGPLDDPRLLQTDTPVNQGSSGGPLADTSGVVVGIVTSRMEPVGGRTFQGVNYAVKSTYLRVLIEQLVPDSELPAALPPGQRTLEPVRDAVLEATVQVIADLGDKAR